MVCRRIHDRNYYTGVPYMIRPRTGNLKFAPIQSTFPVVFYHCLSVCECECVFMLPSSSSPSSAATKQDLLFIAEQLPSQTPDTARFSLQSNSRPIIHATVLATSSLYLIITAISNYIVFQDYH